MPHTLEAPRVYRPLADTSWLNEVAYATWQAVGASVDFYDDLVSERAVTIVGKGECARLERRTGRIGAVSIDAYVDGIEESMPESFWEPLSRVRLGRCVIGKYQEGNVGIVRFLTVPVFAGELPRERWEATAAIDRVAGYGHNWKRGLSQLKLATVDETAHLDNRTLAELTATLPQIIELSPGLVTPEEVTVH